jgi:nucleolar protein 6
MKRKSEHNPAITTNGDALTKKRRRLSNEDSDATPLKKDKKSKTDRKTNIEEEGLDLPVREVKQESRTGPSKKDKKGKKSKKDRKLKREEEPRDLPFDDVVEDIRIEDVEDPKQAPVAAAAASNPPKDDGENKSKAKKRGKKSKKGELSANKIPLPSANGDADPTSTEGEAANKPSKKARFIVFVGNLPYSATVHDIEKHFSAFQPTSVRLLHEKSNPTKSRGVAFVEFAGFDHMKTCLKNLHHSTFTCQGKDHRGQPKVEERKINVELTVGGGGNNDNRKEKIKAKNVKLNEERERRAVEEEKAKVKKETERLIKGGEQKPGEDGIHPSRRARVPGN